jgi:hypothetical protein
MFRRIARRGGRHPHRRPRPVTPSPPRTTLTCTNIAHATTPIGCGGAQSALTTHGTLDMAVIGTANVQLLQLTVGVKTET